MEFALREGSQAPRASRTPASATRVSPRAPTSAGLRSSANRTAASRVTDSMASWALAVVHGAARPEIRAKVSVGTMQARRMAYLAGNIPARGEGGSTREDRVRLSHRGEDHGTLVTIRRDRGDAEEVVVDHESGHRRFGRAPKPDPAVPCWRCRLAPVNLVAGGAG